MVIIVCTVHEQRHGTARVLHLGSRLGTAMRCFSV
jgi:hypothetical protein